MPFNELQRRDSWPPTQIRIRDDEEDLAAIDENPFSFFLTSPDETDMDGDEDLSAGIESFSKSPEVREVSPSDIQRSPLPLEDDDGDSFGLAMPLSLKDFSIKHTSDGRKSRAGKRADDGLKGLGIAIPEFAARGRATLRLTPSRSGRGRGQTRSLSARRPHAWRLPSPDLGSIEEERESDEEMERQHLNPAIPELSVSAPATSYMLSALLSASPSAKPKKRVRFAF